METIGKVADAIFMYLIEEVQVLDDFSVQETEQLSRLFGNLQQSFKKEFSDVTHIEDYVPHWIQFKKVTNMFNLSMVGIVEMWEKDELNEFSAEEIRKWIIALFSDSAFRQKNLAKIK